MKDERVKIVFDCESSDPDDMLTLMLLCAHPRVELRAVTITPGTPDQVGLVRMILGRYGCDVPVGVFRLDHPKQCVSAWHQKLGTWEPSREATPGFATLFLNSGPDVVLLTGAPLKNLGKALEHYGPKLRFKKWVAQGGFAGEGVVPPELQLEKFKGRTVCPTFNFNGDPKSAAAALTSHGSFGKRFLVSKNVCHGVKMDQELRNRLLWPPIVPHTIPESYRNALTAFASYCPDGKALHDTLAMACALDEDIGTWREVQLFREANSWGSYLKEGTNTFITIDYDKKKFEKVLLGE